MSKAAKYSVLTLVILLIVAAVFCFVTASQKTKIENSKITLVKELDTYREREIKYIKENKELTDKLAQVEKAKAELETKLGSLDKDLPSLEKRVEALTQERDQLQERFGKLQKEREDLLAKLEEQPKEKVVYKYIEKDSGEEIVKPVDEQAAAAGTPSPAIPMAAKPPVTAPAASSENEDYWAQVLREKVTLELEVEKVKNELTQSSVDVVELKKKNTDMQLELSKLQDDKDGIEREIKYGNDLANNLALELARAKNDKKFLNDRIERINNENTNLRDQIRQLTSTKIALEKSIVRLNEDKKEIERKLLHTENIIQNRIDEIWQIKDTLEKDFKPLSSQNTGEVELPPIVVSAQQVSMEKSPSIDTKVGVPPGFDGNVVSINEENNFVIIDLGEADGVALGDALSVYRGAQYVAGIEVIQVRKDIAAADIKNQVASIAIGDVVK